MTLCPGSIPFRIAAVDKKFRFFTDWAIYSGIWRLFPVDQNELSLIQKVYLLGKRLHGYNYDHVLSMPIEDRDALVEMEMELIKRENKENSKEIGDAEG